MTRTPRSVSREVVETVMRSAAVRAALAAKARKVAARANALAAGDGIEVNAVVRQGTRPRGRPFAYVESSNVAQEWGDSNTDRRRVLGRAAQAG